MLNDMPRTRIALAALLIAGPLYIAANLYWDRSGQSVQHCFSSMKLKIDLLESKNSLTAPIDRCIDRTVNSLADFAHPQHILLGLLLLTGIILMILSRGGVSPARAEAQSDEQLKLSAYERWLKASMEAGMKRNKPQ